MPVEDEELAKLLTDYYQVSSGKRTDRFFTEQTYSIPEWLTRVRNNARESCTACLEAVIRLSGEGAELWLTCRQQCGVQSSDVPHPYR